MKDTSLKSQVSHLQSKLFLKISNYNLLILFYVKESRLSEMVGLQLFSFIFSHCNRQYSVAMFSNGHASSLFEYVTIKLFELKILIKAKHGK